MVGKLTEAKASYPLPWHAGSLGGKSVEVPVLVRCLGRNRLRDRGWSRGTGKSGTMHSNARNWALWRSEGALERARSAECAGDMDDERAGWWPCFNASVTLHSWSAWARAWLTTSRSTCSTYSPAERLTQKHASPPWKDKTRKQLRDRNTATASYKQHVRPTARSLPLWRRSRAKLEASSISLRLPSRH
ncbi:hypothetical protein P171DRAFT_129596 [Karstenula rhodostoma CBS 690.94]|uniref:Uncharacterized protein n=1 Tax=Karstenula rhodostoma CBS 690.94 TaxID=1392251 RepID=A0A9P4P9L9_9PLEO|nr:hypothetical protein P171DRAFT_129596 [Karstenula rhodostoma CBS 690.94]